MTAVQTQGSSGQGSTRIEHFCRLGRVSRAGFYRRDRERAPRQAETELRDTIQAIAIAHRFYGYRRVGAELRRSHGLTVNHKHVLRLMREDNLLCLRAKPWIPRTTDSRHGFAIVPNLLARLVPVAIDQVWVADITYIHLREEFIYLAVILDAFSRRVIGWALAGHLQASLALEALEMALATRTPAAGFIHHSDRGVQYACNAYSARLQAAGASASMSRIGNPYDNAKAGSFMKTLKAEQVNGKQYRCIEEARADIGPFLETTYNQTRLHSALGYRPPVEFENTLCQTETSERTQQNPVT